LKYHEKSFGFFSSTALTGIFQRCPHDCQQVWSFSEILAPLVVFRLFDSCHWRRPLSVFFRATILAVTTLIVDSREFSL
jgi:hypothetical protein